MILDTPMHAQHRQWPQQTENTERPEPTICTVPLERNLWKTKHLNKMPGTHPQPSDLSTVRCPCTEIHGLHGTHGKRVMNEASERNAQGIWTCHNACNKENGQKTWNTYSQRIQGGPGMEYTGMSELVRINRTQQRHRA